MAIQVTIEVDELYRMIDERDEFRDRIALLEIKPPKFSLADVVRVALESHAIHSLTPAQRDLLRSDIESSFK